MSIPAHPTPLGSLPPPVARAAAWLRENPAKGGLVGLTVLAFLAVYAPVFAWLWDTWMANPYYSHGVLIVPLAGYVAWRRRGRVAELPRRVHDVDLLWVVAAGGLFVAGRLLRSVYLQAWSLLPLLVGLVLVTQGRHRARGLAWPLGILVLALPVPFLGGVFGPLQLVAAGGSATLGELYGLAVSWDAVSITVDGMTFAVVPLCAGLNSTLSLVVVTAAAFLVFPTEPLAQALVYPLVVPVALASNIARITSTIVVAAHMGPDRAMAFFHGPGALVLYGLALVLVGGLVWAAHRLAPRTDAASRRREAVQEGAP